MTSFIIQDILDIAHRILLLPWSQHDYSNQGQSTTNIPPGLTKCHSSYQVCVHPCCLCRLWSWGWLEFEVLMQGIIVYSAVKNSCLAMSLDKLRARVMERELQLYHLWSLLLNHIPCSNACIWSRPHERKSRCLIGAHRDKSEDYTVTETLPNQSF